MDVDEHHVAPEVWAEQDALCPPDDAARIVRMRHGKIRHPWKVLREELRELREPTTRYRQLHVQPVVPVERAQPDPPEHLLAAARFVNHAVADEQRRRERDDGGDIAAADRGGSSE